MVSMVHATQGRLRLQFGWIGQLAKMPGEWQVHLDGKYNLLYISSAKRESQMEYVTL
jgi:hypothetical protein